MLCAALAAVPVSATASTVSVHDGTLSMPRASMRTSSRKLANDHGEGGPVAEARACSAWCAGMAFHNSFVWLGNLGVWSGSAPTADAGCEVHPEPHLPGAAPGPHAVCPGVRLIDVTLGAGDDLVAAHAVDAVNTQYGGPISIPVPVRLDGGAGQDGLSYAGCSRRHWSAAWETTG